MSARGNGARCGKGPVRAQYPHTFRLTKPTDFNRVFRKPLVTSDRCFKVLARPNDKRHSRLGMAVSRQVDRRAAGRNRIKRVVRESFRQWQGSRVQRLDIVVLPRRESASISNTRLSHSLSRHWSRLERQLEGNTDG